MAKNQQLQIRLTAQEKAWIRKSAAKAGKNISDWVLNRVLPQSQLSLQNLLQDLAASPTQESARFCFAEMNDFFEALSAGELTQAIENSPSVALKPFHANMLAAMVEVAAARKNVPVPNWIKEVPALTEPYFASNLISLRPYLLRSSPIPFRKRNLFVDSTLGDRV